MIPIKADYLAERSIPDNIDMESSQNEFVIGISYLMMFIYVGISIGFFPNLVYNRFLLGLSGIFVVIAALIISIGISSYMGVAMTMISAEVVPFLILAIGVDNMFLISRAEREVNPDIRTMELRCAYALKEIGPSIFTAAFCEALAFFIGMMTDVPALWSFCLVAGFAVIADFLLQITVYVSCLCLDGKRIQSGKYDIVFCAGGDPPPPPRKEWIKTLVEKYFIPFVFYPVTMIVIIGIAIALTIIGLMSAEKIKLGMN